MACACKGGGANADTRSIVTPTPVQKSPPRSLGIKPSSGISGRGTTPRVLTRRGVIRTR